MERPLEESGKVELAGWSVEPVLFFKGTKSLSLQCSLTVVHGWHLALHRNWQLPLPLSHGAGLHLGTLKGWNSVSGPHWTIHALDAH